MSVQVWYARIPAPMLLKARGFSTHRYITLTVMLIFNTDFWTKERLLAVYKSITVFFFQGCGNDTTYCFTINTGEAAMHS